VKRAFYVAALAMAEQHVAQGEVHIAKQRRIIVELEERGSDTTEAYVLLGHFLATQQQHEDDRQRFIEEIAKLEPHDA
jgi:hypothetical protein